MRIFVAPFLREQTAVAVAWLRLFLRLVDTEALKSIRFSTHKRNAVFGHCTAKDKNGDHKIACFLNAPYPYLLLNGTRLETPAEGAVWLLGHELYHYLWWTKQRYGPIANEEADADAMGDDLLALYRHTRAGHKL